MIVRPRKARPVTLATAIKIQPWADEKAREIAHEKGWDFYVLREKWLSFAKEQTANNNPPKNAGAAFVAYCKKQERLR